MPILIPFVAGAAVGAFVVDRLTGAFRDAGNGILKVVAVAGIGYLGFEVWKRGGFK